LACRGKVIAIPQSRCCHELLQMQPSHRSVGPLKIGAFGRFHKQKGFDLLIDAMAQIPPYLAELKLAGTGPDAAKLRARSQYLPNVQIVDAFSSPSAFLSEVDTVAIPSRWEAFGLVGIEARASGRPIVAAQIDGLIDQTDETGFPHAPNDVPSLVDAIKRAATANDINQRGQTAQKRASWEYEEMIERWVALLQSA